MIIYFTALFAYYNDGNVTSIAKDKKAVSIGYDINNRLTSYGQTKYTYDAEGNRIKKETGETATTYLYDTSGTLPRVLESKTGEELTVYIYGKELISQQTGDSTEYYHYDYRGSTVALTDKTGNVTDRYSYDVYGNSDHITGTETTPFQYTGSSGVQTDENGLMYMCTRYYNPEIMRFLSADVLTGDVKNTQSLNRYAYCQGNPISFTDPFGMSPEVRAHNEKERAKAVRQTVSLRVHNVLDAGGMFPVAGAFADGTNGMIYLIEGDMEGVAFSAIAFIPVIGQVSTPAKYLDDGAELVFKHGDDAAEAVWHSDDAFRFTMGYSDDFERTAKTNENIVYRALNSKDSERLGQGLGLEAKNPVGTWKLDEHLIGGSGKSSWANDPFISTTTDIDVARGFNQSGSNLGVVKIDLNKVPSKALKGYEIYPRVNGVEGLPYHYSIWQQEVSVYKNIPKEAIRGFVK